MRTKEQDDVVVELHKRGKSLRKIALIVNSSHEKIRKILADYGIKSFPQKRGKKKKDVV